MSSVSVIVPCFNEEKTIFLLLDALYAQTFPRDQMQVIIADGMSTDQTREQIVGFQQEHTDMRLKVVDNPAGTIPAGLNCAIAAASGEYIVRLDAHSVPQPDYVSGCINALEQGRGDNVGGVWEIRPRGDGWQARSIALAAAHPLGVGDAFYRYADRAQPVDTVPFGAFRLSLIKKIGGFDESLLSNEDYEFNTRLRKAGGTIWLDPEIRSVYFARRTFMELARQYWRYGYWKARMLRRYPETIRWRQALPPLFVLSLIICMLLWFWFPLAGWVFVLELAAYASILLLTGIQMSIEHHGIYYVIGVPLSIAIMHLSWGSAFLWSMLKK
jgi:succinoglycan biosynthesis protein ExoA